MNNLEDINEADIQQDNRRIKKHAYNIFTKYQKLCERQEGYAFGYPRSSEWLNTLDIFSRFINQRYSAFKLQVIDNAEPLVWLYIDGDEHVKKFVHDMINTDLKKYLLHDNFSTSNKIISRYRLLTGSIRTVPDFVIIGAAKSGTTSLYSYLVQHGCVRESLKKEIYFFDKNFTKGISWYRSHFPTVFERYYARYITKRDLLCGEATPCYILHPHVPRRIFRVLPHIKIIIMLRNPVDRAYSFYQMQFRKGIESLSFEEALDKEEKRLAGEWEKMVHDEHYYSFNYQNYSYITRGMYADQMLNWLKYFSRSQMMVIIYEDFYSNTADVLNKACDFLALPNYTLLENKELIRYNYFPYPKMNKETRQHLINYFSPHNEKLFKLLDIQPRWHE